MAHGNSMKPVRLQWFEDTLFVSYNGVARIDKYTTDLKLVGSIELIDPEPVRPTSFVLIDSLLVVADHARHLVVIYDRNGNFRESFGTTPDGRPLSPFSLDAYGGVAYIGDLNLGRVLAVSLVDAGEITERGELILTIPGDSSSTIGFPSAVKVTPDGRLLIGNAQSGRVEVYTCDGRHVYNFDSVATDRTIGPQAFDADNVLDPSLRDTTEFDPSGIWGLGRVHLVDANNAKIHIFNPLGVYVASYPDDSLLIRPSGLAVDRKRQRIFVADPGAGKILVFKYER